MSYRLPPLNALKAFEAAGRHLSFKQAAMELSVTPGAVSQQVRHLEQSLGVPLFERLHNSLLLTAHGEGYLRQVAEALELLSAATDGLSRSLRPRVLRVGVTPDLDAAVRSVVQDLAGDADRSFVRICPVGGMAELVSGAVDVLLRSGEGPYPGWHTEPVKGCGADGVPAYATLVAWPGLAQCREVRRLREALAAGPDCGALSGSAR